MILISHRGNINGRKEELENTVPYIERALSYGYDVEVDVWCINSQWFLGHDEPLDGIDISFLYSSPKLWIHCKNYEALKELSIKDKKPNFFYHTDEDYVLTSKGYIWAFISKYGEENTICVLPEKSLHDYEICFFSGICSDVIENYKGFCDD